GATAVGAGWYGGAEPFVLMIQHAGLYASVNTLRGVAMDGKVPVLYLIGLLSREKDKDPRESRHSMVRFCEPLLDTFAVPHARLEGPNDVHLIPEYYRLAWQRRGPAALLLGPETSYGSCRCSRRISPSIRLAGLPSERGLCPRNPSAGGNRAGRPRPPRRSDVRGPPRGRARAPAHR